MSFNILDYSDYRLFLKDWYSLNKTNNQKYSYRQFAVDLGFTYSNFLHLVVTGKRNCSEDAIRKIQAALLKSAQEKKYFSLLVAQNQEVDSVKKEILNEKMKSLHGKKRQLIDSDQARFFMNWYIPVLREVICLKGFVSNLSWISKKLLPTVPQDKILEGLQILERLGYIKKEGNRYNQVSSHLTTSSEINSEWIARYHQEMIGLALEALQIPSDLRDISSMTMGVSQSQFDRIKKKIVAFRDEIQHEFEDDVSQTPDRVVQLNIQFFPLTHK